MIHSGLLICSFFVKERYGRDDSKVINLNNEIHIEQVGNEETYNSIWKLFSDFFNNHLDLSDDESSMKLFSIARDSIKEFDTDSYHCASFIINSGSYVIEGKLTNRTTKEVKYNRTREDADVKQFHALIYIPKDADGIKVQKGILLFQSIGTFGVKTITTKQIKDYFAQKGLTFETRSVSISVFLKRILEENRIKKVTLLKNCTSIDSSDNMLISTGREEKVYYSPKFKESFIQRIIDFVDGKKDDTIFEINDNLYEDISISFNLSGRTRTAKLKDIDRFSLVEDIPDSIYNNGNTNYDDIIRHMIGTAESYKEKMVFRIAE